jgi:hypothetical protein
VLQVMWSLQQCLWGPEHLLCWTLWSVAHQMGPIPNILLYGTVITGLDLMLAMTQYSETANPGQVNENASIVHARLRMYIFFQVKVLSKLSATSVVQPRLTWTATKTVIIYQSNLKV